LKQWKILKAIVKYDCENVLVKWTELGNDGQLNTTLILEQLNIS
jgi:hypothetical protein